MLCPGSRVSGVGSGACGERDEAFKLHFCLLKASGLFVGSKLSIVVKASRIWLSWGQGPPVLDSLEE